jgi:hypothetical protein
MQLSIDVVSDAGWSTFGPRGPLLGAASVLASHDLGLVKPALLYADQVTLYSGNYFTASQIDRVYRRTQMPMQVVRMLAELATFRRDELRTIGVGEGDVPPIEEASEALRDWDTASKREDRESTYSFVDEFLKPLAIRWEEYFPKVFPRFVEALRAERGSLFSRELEVAIDAKILNVVPHTEIPPNPNKTRLFGEKPEEYQDRAMWELPN